MSSSFQPTMLGPDNPSSYGWTTLRRVAMRLVYKSLTEHILTSAETNSNQQHLPKSFSSLSMLAKQQCVSLHPFRTDICNWQRLTKYRNHAADREKKSHESEKMPMYKLRCQDIVAHRHLNTTAHSGDSVVQLSPSAELQSFGAATCSRLQLHTHD